MQTSRNLTAFLEMIAFSELGPKLIEVSDNGYNIIVGSTPMLPILFDSYADHPRKLVDLGNGLKSTAAGRYQLLARYFDSYKKQLGLPDFGHDSQDAIAIQQIRECKALPLIEEGNFDIATRACARIWASLPGSPYHQHTNDMSALRAAYEAAGGIVNA